MFYIHYNVWYIIKNVKKQKNMIHNRWKVANKSIFTDHSHVQISTQRLWNNYYEYENSLEKIDEIIFIVQKFCRKNMKTKKLKLGL